MATAVGTGNDLLPDIAQGAASVELEVVVDTGPNPLIDITHAGDGSGRLFLVDPSGVIRILDASDTLLPTAFLNAPASPTDRAMSSLAFHPGYATNGKLYVITGEAVPNGSTPHYSAPQTDTASAFDNVLVEYQVSATNPNIVDLGTARELLRVHQAHRIHNMNDLAFGADGFLYIAMGDGGYPGSPTPFRENAQDTTLPFGKLLRIDIDSTGTNGRYAIPPTNPFANGAGGNAPEIFSLGFRNPWRITLDAQTGELWVGENGVNTIESIVRAELGANHGWPVKEGSFLFDPGTMDANVDPSPDPQYTNPWAEYDHNGTTKAFGSVIGGFVARTLLYPQLYGLYLSHDWVAGEIVAMAPATGALELVETDAAGEQLTIAAEITWGEGEDGRLYLGRSNGELLRLIATPAVPVSSWVARALILLVVVAAALVLRPWEARSPRPRR